jgi:two-component system, cell cycle response regulator
MLKFLIIEDDESIRMILRTLLKRNFTCQIIEAENGQIGLKLLEENIPDVILMDISMPVMDGMETLAKIRTNPIFKKIPVIVITANSDKKAVGNLAVMGISDYLLKPIDVNNTVKRIQKFIQLYEAKKNGFTKDNSTSENKIEHILIVDKEKDFKSFFSSILSKYFIIHQASSGTEGLDIFSKLNPKYIFVGDAMGLLDKKILTEKIRNIAIEENVLIYLLVDNMKKLSTKVFNYDGIIVKSNDSEIFLQDVNSFLHMIPKEEVEEQK